MERRTYNHKKSKTRLQWNWPQLTQSFHHRPQHQDKKGKNNRNCSAGQKESHADHGTHRKRRTRYTIRLSLLLKRFEMDILHRRSTELLSLTGLHGRIVNIERIRPRNAQKVRPALL